MLLLLGGGRFLPPAGLPPLSHCPVSVGSWTPGYLILDIWR